MKSKFLHVVVGALLCFSTHSASADTEETRTYDIRDLLIAIPDHEVIGKVAPQEPAEPRSRQDRMEAVADAVRGALPKPSAASANIRELGGQLIITTGAAGHSTTVGVLKQARATRSVQVMVTTSLLRVTDAQLKDLDDDLRGRVFAATINPKRSSVELSPADVRALREANGGEQIVAPRLTTFSGQRASIEMQPQEKFNACLAIDVRAVAEQSGRSVSLSFKVTHESKSDAVATIEAEYVGPATRDLLFVSKSDAATRANGKRLLVIVNATPIVQRETEASPK